MMAPVARRLVTVDTARKIDKSRFGPSFQKPTEHI
jgi:hypothetical protein